MANTETLRSLMDRVLYLADHPKYEHQTADDLAHLREWINDGLAELHDIITNSFAEYHKSVKTISLVAGQEDYALPEDFYKALKVFYLTQARRFRIERFNLNNIDGFQVGPVQTGEIELWYAPLFKKLQRDADYVDQIVPPGWEQLAVFHAVGQLKRKHEEDPSTADADKGSLAQRIVNMAEPRDEGEPEAPEDVYGRWVLHRNFFDARYFRYRIMGSKIMFVELERYYGGYL